MRTRWLFFIVPLFLLFVGLVRWCFWPASVPAALAKSVPVVPISVPPVQPAHAVVVETPTDLPGTIALGIKQLQAKDVPSLMQTFISPDEWEEWRAEMLHNGEIQSTRPMMSEVNLREMLTAGQMRQVMQRLGIPVDETLVTRYTHRPIQDQARAQFLNDLQSLLSQPPKISGDGNHALGEIRNADGRPGSTYIFQKVDGRWYLQD